MLEPVAVGTPARMPSDNDTGDDSSEHDTAPPLDSSDGCDQPQPTPVGKPHPLGRRLEAAANRYFADAVGPLFVGWAIAATAGLELFVPPDSWLYTIAGVGIFTLVPPIIISIAVAYLYVVADALHYERAAATGQL